MADPATRTPSPRHLLADLPVALPQELFETLLATAVFRVERIVSTGHASPPGFWYDQPEHEWVLLLSGEAGLQFEGQPPMALTPGTAVHIPARQRHRVAWTDLLRPTVWLAIHYAADAT